MNDMLMEPGFEIRDSGFVEAGPAIAVFSDHRKVGVSPTVTAAGHRRVGVSPTIAASLLSAALESRAIR
ncbi:hypothetical protein [Pseudomarimonas arenosa]|uniref:Uncharacterized protein n=1 Tax=Pseudomarimonas arenosa TaxID=2774145 RepID=A0AAW3ZI19_9GAMM|nr:hypothetical protein [Pseudomarimonas arenosa]MBD8525428.1 hypothetical protein [Pseudomarimonas arenosa]